MGTKTVMCFGDSLTWGYVPKDPPSPSGRHPRDVRWTGVLADRLGHGHHVVEEGLNGRTTTAADPFDPRVDGSAYLPSALASHLPLDLVVLMLGTNDAKASLGRTPLDIGTGMATLVGQVLSSAGGVGTRYPAPQVLVVAPPPLVAVPDPWFDMVFAGGQAKTAELARVYGAMASSLGVPFFDAGSVVTASEVDGVHLAAESNRALGEALAPVVSGLLAD